ncbi:MAG: hypothetical protein K2X47_00670, partial [Bdellovibrionales bacterium]|nr:hypothetical protein [Bdellovibrionales bacterium]
SGVVVGCGAGAILYGTYYSKSIPKRIAAEARINLARLAPGGETSSLYISEVIKILKAELPAN